MKRDTIGGLLTAAVLILGGYWVYQIWKKNGGGALGSDGGVMAVEANPYIGSLTAANEGVAAAMKNGDPTLNKTLADILNPTFIPPAAGFQNFGPVISIPPTMLGGVMPGGGWLQ